MLHIKGKKTKCFEDHILYTEGWVGKDKLGSKMRRKIHVWAQL